MAFFFIFNESINLIAIILAFILIFAGLKISNTKNGVSKKYSSYCLSSYPRYLINPPDFSTLRDGCLKEISKNINSQLKNDFKKGKINDFL